MQDPLPPDPFALFGQWFAQAKTTEPSYPEAFALAAVDTRGRPSVRTVLLKGWDERGFVFYTNLEGAKGSALTANPLAEALFYWKSSERQIRIGGPVTQVANDEADAYYDKRPRGSRIGAWASLQSRPMPTRESLAERVALYEAKFPGDPPRPPHWTGLRIVPDRFEFWEERAFRQHERWTYQPTAGGLWRIQRLYP
jgi:pyridoxamine 5'-phosphate oxidase